MRKIWMLVLTLLIPIISFAQTTHTFKWEYIGANPTEVATYTQVVMVDTTTIATPPICILKLGTTTDTSCQVSIPALTQGTHTLSVTATRNGLSAEGRLTGVDPTNFPDTPSSLRISITVIVNIP